MKIPAAILVFLTLQLVASATEAGPVGKVVALLTDLKTKLEQDSDADEKDFEKHECWCKNVDASKKELIAQEKQREQELATEIEQEKAKDNQLVQQIDDDKDQIKDNTASQKTGGDQEAKQESASQVAHIQDNAEMNSLSKAQTLLKGGNLRASGSVRGVLDHAYQDDAVAEEDLAKHDSTLLTSFERWHTDMVKDLQTYQGDMRTKQKTDAEVRAEIAEDIEIKVDTEEQRKADEAFLAEAKTSCAARRTEYNNRTALRNTEMAGVNKAVEILESQRELLSTTFKDVALPSFLQLSSEQARARRALGHLKVKAKRTHSLRLASLAAQLEEALPNSGFEEVLAKVQGMMTKIKTEAKTDTKKKGYCEVEYQVIAKKTQKMTFLVQKSTDAIRGFETRLTQLEEDKADAQDEIADIDADLKKSLQLRTAENAAFKKAKADDQLAIVVLKNTSNALSKYYEEYAANSKASFLEYDPAQLSDDRQKLRNQENKYALTNDLSQESAASSVLAVMERIIENLGNEIADSMKEEKAGQLDYEKMRDLALASKSKLEDKVTSIDQRISARDTSKRDETKIKDDVSTDLQEQNNYKASIKSECDWLFSNFEDRANTREAEMDGLLRAKELLSGASFVQQGAVQQQRQQPLAASVSEQRHGSVEVSEVPDQQWSLMNYLDIPQLK